MKNYTNLFDINKKVSIILGASRGIGKEIQEAYAQYGSIVYGIGRSKSKEKNYFQCDIQNFGKLQNIFKKIYKKHKYIDILVNCASITSSKKKNYKENFEEIIKTNLTSHFLSSKLFYNYTNKKRGGKIINISSIGSKVGFPDNPAYVSSKSAISGLTKSLAIDFKNKNINVNSILPGYIKTSMTIKSYNEKKKRDKRTNRTILKRWGNPEDIIGAAIFLASNASNYMTGSEIIIDGGWLSKGL